MTENEDWPYTFEVLPLSKMIVDDAYQRPLTTFVDKITKNYDPALVGTLVVSKRSAKEYAVVDGQTRMEALGLLDVTEVPCLVYLNLTQAQEASLFARLQKERRGIASFHRFRAALVAGEEEPTAINEICNDVGFKVGLEKGEISAVAALEYAYRKDPEILERLLYVCIEAWGDDAVPAGDIIRGIALFMVDQRKAKKTVDDERLAQRLSGESPEALRRRASALKEGVGEGGSGGRYMADAIAAAYRRKK
jgi:hypothetical protein